MAPSTTSALHPIVLPPVPVPPYFTTLGSGLLHATHPRELSTTLHTLLLSYPPLANNDRPKPWWRAQCLLYGLNAPEKRTIPELRAMLVNAMVMGGLKVPEAMQEMERKENGRFRKLNAQMREATAVAVKGRAPPKKDPLKGVRGADAKVTKTGKKPAAKAGGVTVNVTVNMPTPQGTKARAKKTEPAPRAKQAAKRGGAAPKTARSKGPAAPKESASRAKQTAKRGGAAPKTARSKGSAAPREPATRPKPMMRRGRGGSGAPARAPRVSDHQVAVKNDDEVHYSGDSHYDDHEYYKDYQSSEQGAYEDDDEVEEVDRGTWGARGRSGQAAWGSLDNQDNEDNEDYEHHEGYSSGEHY